MRAEAVRACRSELQKEAFLGQKKPLADPGREEALATADDLKQTLGRRFNISPYLSGSMATGLNLPGKYDYDYGARVTSKPKFDRLVQRLERSKDIKASPYNEAGTDYHVFTGQVGDKDVDLALMYGDKALEVRKGVEGAKKKVEAMSPEEREKILRTKARLKGLKDAPVLGALKWKGKPVVQRFIEQPWKRKLDLSLGMVRAKKEALPGDGEKVSRELTPQERGRLMRSNIFGHRTSNLAPIIKSQQILSAAEAGKKGFLKSVETADPTSRSRQDAKGKKKLRSEVFLTKGLLPATSSYGKYGILFEKQKAVPSRYLNTIPEEHLAPDVKRSKMTFVVPDKEFGKWQKSHPDRRIMRESEVPQEKMLPSKSYKALADRVTRGPTLSQKTEEVEL